MTNRQVIAVELPDGPLDKLDGETVSFALGWMSGGNPELEEQALEIAKSESACAELAQFLNAKLGLR